MISALQFQLNVLHAHKALGHDVDDQIVGTLIAMLKESYVRGDIELDYLERGVEHILNGGQVGFLQPGERILRSVSPEERVTCI